VAAAAPAAAAAAQGAGPPARGPRGRRSRGCGGVRVGGGRVLWVLGGGVPHRVPAGAHLWVGVRARGAGGQHRAHQQRLLVAGERRTRVWGGVCCGCLPGVCRRLLSPQQLFRESNALLNPLHTDSANHLSLKPRAKPDHKNNTTPIPRRGG